MKEKIDTFLVNVTILEGRHYAWASMDSYVHIRVGNHKNCTSIRRNSDCPYYNEYFVFEFKTDLQTLIDKLITITVIRPRNCWRKRKILGYCTLDLATIWSQPEHLFFQKWAILNSNSAEFAGPRGYLKVTLCILTKGEQAKIPLTNPVVNEEIEGNLLLPEGITLERQKAIFIFKVFKGEDIVKFKPRVRESLKSPRSHNKDLPNTVVEITFAGFTVVTSVQKNTHKPVWNEMLSISELFPPLCQRVKIVLKITNSSLRAVKYFNLYSIANDQEHGFLPTFGPTYVHFYGNDAFGSVFVGKILMSLHTQLQYEHATQLKPTLKKPILPINENSLYKYEPVLLFGAILRVNALDRRFSKKEIQFEISIGNSNLQNVIGSGGDGCPLHITPPFLPKAANEAYWYLDFENRIPCFSFQNSFPDLRKRFYNANMIKKLSTDLKSRLDDIEPLFEYERLQIPSAIIESKLIETLDVLALGCRKYIDMVQPTLGNYVTQLDREKFKLCIREMEIIETLAKTIYSTKTKKKSFRKAQKLYKRLSLLIDHPQDCWPKIIIYMIYDNNKVSTLTINSETVTFSMIDEEAGRRCGKIQTLFFETPLKLVNPRQSSTACIMDIILWIGLRKHMEFCFHSLPECFKYPMEDTYTTVPRYMVNPEKHIFQCRAHVYQGNFKFGMDSNGLADLFTRIVLNGSSARTQVKKSVLNPLWNETIILSNIFLYGSKSYLKSQPPMIIVEVIDRDQKLQNDLMGRTLIKPSVKLREEPYTQPEFPPKLKWYNITNRSEIIGNILTCIELLEVEELLRQLAKNIDQFHLQIVDLDEVKKKKPKHEVMRIPDDIRPKLTGYKIDVLFWGLRHLKKLHKLSITKPKITLDCTMATLDSDGLSKNEMNFSTTQKELIVDLPQEETYTPSISFKLFDNRSFGRFTYVGCHSACAQHFMFYPITREERELKLTQAIQKSYDSMDSQAVSIEEPPAQLQLNTTVAKFKVENEVINCCAFCKKLRKKKEKANKKASYLIKNEAEHDIIEEDEYTDWWNKYFSSIQSKSVLHLNIDEDRPFDSKFRLKIYQDELEHQSEFGGFQDMLVPFTIIRGEKTGDEDVDEKNVMGIFKGNLRMYPWPPHKNAEYVTPAGLHIKNGYFQNFPSNESVSFIARVYCIRGIKLRPRDVGGKSDPYLVAFMGNQIFNDSKNYIPKEINPIFGRCFEFSGTFPHDTILTIQVWDWDRSSKHDFIGETVIDLENRYYTKHRAYCGLSYEYMGKGYTPWRDIQTPCEILESLCKKGNIPQPQYFDTYVRIGNLLFAPKVEENEKPKSVYNKQDLALTVLHRWHEVPVIGCHLVPEHVETRSLYDSHQPGLEQGKIQLWIDIFPRSDLPPPRPVDITPKVPQKYELRVIVWNTEDVLLVEDDFFVGEKKCDIYVKGWITSSDQSQSTDVHYRSLSGEGNFNWRFVFPFKYLKTEHKIVVVKKERAFDIVPSEQKIPCQLTLQVWDNDTFSPDDFIGSLTFDLRRMPRGAKTSNKCTLKFLDPGAPQINLFRVKRTKGWWPFRDLDQEKKEYVLTGKLEAEFHLVTEEEAQNNPTGLGRKEPNPLPNPKMSKGKFLRQRKSFRSFMTNTLSNISSIKTETWWNPSKFSSFFK